MTMVLNDEKRGDGCKVLKMKHRQIIYKFKNDDEDGSLNVVK